MNYVIVAVKDRLAIFQNVMIFKTNSEAIRWFRLTCTGDNNSLRIKDDLSLFKIGDIDLETAVITPVAPQHLADGSEFTVEKEV